MSRRFGEITRAVAYKFEPNSRTGHGRLYIFLYVAMGHVCRYKIGVLVLIAEANTDKFKDIGMFRLGPNLQLPSKTLVLSVSVGQVPCYVEGKLTVAVRRRSSSTWPIRNCLTATLVGGAGDLERSAKKTTP